MAKVNGTVMLIAEGSNTVLWTKTATLNLEQDLPDSSTKDSAGWAEHINGQRNWTIDYDGAYDIIGTGLTPNEIIALIVGRDVDTTVKFGLTASLASGFSGKGTFKNISITAGMEDVVTFSGTIVGNGPLAAY